MKSRVLKDCVFIIVEWTVEAEGEEDDDDDDDGDNDVEGERKVYFVNGFVFLISFRKELSGARS
jgi:hypothetical protein